MILVRRVPIIPTPNDIESVSYKLSQSLHLILGGPRVEVYGGKKGGNAGDVPLFQLDLARDRTRLRRDKLLQVAHRVRGETFHADCVLDAKKSKINRQMEMRFS
jgi:hypothetical protein